MCQKYVKKGYMEIREQLYLKPWKIALGRTILHYPFPKSTSKFEHFRKKDEPQRLFVSDIIGGKKQGYLTG